MREIDQQFKIHIDSKVTQTMGLIAADLDGEKVMMSVEQGKYYGLDSIGSRIWDLITQPISVREVVKVLIKEYEVNEKKCQEEVSSFFNKLYEKGLISLA